MTRIIVLLAGALVAVPAAAQTPTRIIESDCRWDRGSEREQYCETREYALGERAALDVDGRTNGGIRVTGWDRSDVRLVARVEAWGRTEEEAREIARGITVSTGERIRAEGAAPSVGGWRDRDWAVSYELHVPRSVDLTLRASNGGIRLESVAGDVDARTTNGGIAVVDGGGRIRGETTNGGLHIELTGTTWRGDGLDLRTTNGGVEIVVPEGYSARLETGTVNGGMRIDLPITVQGRIDRTIRTELGRGGALIRATTTNGGVAITRG